MTKSARNVSPSFYSVLEWTDVLHILSNIKQHRRKLAFSPAHIVLENTHPRLCTMTVLGYSETFHLSYVYQEHLGGFPINKCVLSSDGRLKSIHGAGVSWNSWNPINTALRWAHDSHTVKLGECLASEGVTTHQWVSLYILINDLTLGKKVEWFCRSPSRFNNWYSPNHSGQDVKHLEVTKIRNPFDYSSWFYRMWCPGLLTSYTDKYFRTTRVQVLFICLLLAKLSS